MPNSNLIDVAKYFALVAAVYLVFRFVPTVVMSSRDIMLISLIVLFVYITIEKMSSNTNQNQESCACGPVTVRENMTTLSETLSNVKNDIESDIESGIHKVESILPGAESPITQQGNYLMTTSIVPMDGVNRGPMRSVAGTINDDIPYSDYNTLPMAAQNTGSFEYGYSFLPPEKWYPTPPNPPICVTDKRCPVSPIYTNGTNIDLKEWDSCRRITGPDNIKSTYVDNKLNAGR